MEELTIGATFADHEILGVAGAGAMGVVFRARSLAHGRDVALKVIKPELSSDREFRIRFQREYEAEVSIQHPNVVRVYGAGAKGGRLYVAMQYVDGSDLAALLRGGRRLEAATAARLIAQVADALDAAHAHGIVHRDVKPANVLIEGEGAGMHCVLTDFGLMKNLSGAGAPLTVAGSFLGSCDYAAPEQLLGERIDARVDVYALGCMLFQAVTGQVPFPRPVSAATMLAHMDEPPPRITDVLPGAPGRARRGDRHRDGQAPGRALSDGRRARARGAQRDPLSMEAVILCGVQGSGKTTLYRDRFLETHARVSMDLLRTRAREQAFLKLCLDTRQPFVVDNTNPTAADRRRYLEPARAAGFSVVGYLVEVDAAVAHGRNAARERTSRRGPARRRAPARAARAGGGLRRAVARHRGAHGGWRIEPLLSTPPLF